MQLVAQGRRVICEKRKKATNQFRRCQRGKSAVHQAELIISGQYGSCNSAPHRALHFHGNERPGTFGCLEPQEKWELPLNHTTGNLEIQDDARQFAPELGFSRSCTVQDNSEISQHAPRGNFMCEQRRFRRLEAIRKSSTPLLRSKRRPVAHSCLTLWFNNKFLLSKQ